MRRALAALVVTVVAVVLLARFETEPPRTVNPNSALEPARRRGARPGRSTPAPDRSPASARASSARR